MTERSQSLSRRRFLLGLVAGATAVVAGFAVVKRHALLLVADKLRHNTSPYRLDRATGSGELAPDAMATIVAFAGTLVPWEAGAEVGAAMTREFVDGRCRYEPGSLALYEDAARLLDEEVSGPGSFAALPLVARTAVLVRVMPPPIRSRRDWRHVWNVMFRYEETRVAELVAGDLLANFYNDDRSWAFLAEGRGA